MKRLDICLVHPEIPQNTGNIGRLAAATNSRLHLIEPLGFSLHDRYLKRAGLDYWPFLDFATHPDWESYLTRFPDKPRLAFLSTKATKPYTEIPDDVTSLVFGCETKGLPQEYFSAYPEDFYTIPMPNPNVRSLNLANSVALVLYSILMR